MFDIAVKMCGFEKIRIFFAFFLYKNLHISKNCCKFALSFQIMERGNPKRKPTKTE